MRFAISVPQRIPDGEFDPARLRDYLIRAESFGFESAWTQEAVLSSTPTLAPLELMTFAAACTIQSTWPKLSARWISSVVDASRWA